MKNELTQAIEAACMQLFATKPNVVLTRTDEQFGDYATNIALQLAGQVGKKPRDIADLLASILTINVRDIATVTVAGPGFLNFTLTDQALASILGEQPIRNLSGKKFVVEYSDPNPFKPLHAGHLYTTLVGDSISRLIESAGATIVRINFGGDVGLHVARSMWAIVKTLGGELPEKLAAIPEVDRPAWLGARYVEGTIAYEENEGAKAAIIAINKRVYQLHEENDRLSPFARMYWTTRQWSYDYFAELYQQLQVRPFDRYIPESEVTPLAVSTIREQLKNGIFQESDGAVVFDGDTIGLHTRVFINSVGLPTYEAKDVALSLTKWRDYHFDQSIIITANEQEQYMRVVLAAMEKFAPEPAERTRHLTHGTVKLLGGTKMSSRKGNVVTALQILDSARQAGAATGMTPAEHTILAAVKYAFAKVRIGGDIIYDPEESIALEGNSGPYLQYAHARARSILHKSKVGLPERITHFDTDERRLARTISEYSEVVELATKELLPHYICTYLYGLAQTFNAFYEHNRVIGSDREAIRKVLVQQYADILRAGLGLLGITAPEAM